MSLLIVGSVAYDVIELPGREPIEGLGGSASYFTTAASILTRPSLIAVVGDDFLPEDHAFLNGRGIDTSGLMTRTGPTFRWQARYHKDMKGRDTLRTDLGVFADFSPVIGPGLNHPDILFLGCIKPSLQRCVMSQVARPRLVGLDTIECWIADDREDLVELLKSTDILFVNDDEVMQLGCGRSVVASARAVMDLGVPYVVVKRGEFGAILFHGDRIWLFPAFPLDGVQDPTGAGDSFAGGALGFLDVLQEFDTDAIRLAMAVGTVMGSLCVEGFGPRHLAGVTVADLQGRLEAYLDMMSLDKARAIAAMSALTKGGNA